MNCTEVVAHLSEYLDGISSDADAATIEEHLAACDRCVRYRNVLVHGAELLRALPEPELREDFEPRLQHRLYHVDDERTLRSHAASGTPALAVLGIAILLTAVAWSPTIFSGDGRAPVVQLPPIVVDRAPRQTSPFRPAASLDGRSAARADAEIDGLIWEGTLLYDYTPLYQRYERRARLRQVGSSDR